MIKVIIECISTCSECKFLDWRFSEAVKTHCWFCKKENSFIYDSINVLKDIDPLCRLDAVGEKRCIKTPVRTCSECLHLRWRNLGGTEEYYWYCADLDEQLHTSVNVLKITDSKCRLRDLEPDDTT